VTADRAEDFENPLRLFHQHGVRYLIIGGLAFIYHAKPRYTKDMDLWPASDESNIEAANQALVEFGSPVKLDPARPEEILQLGVGANRIDLLRDLGQPSFEMAWERRIAGSFGHAPANRIDLETLIEIKSAIEEPRHQEDARVLRRVRELKKSVDEGGHR